MPGLNGEQAGKRVRLPDLKECYLSLADVKKIVAGGRATNCYKR